MSKTPMFPKDWLDRAIDIGTERVLKAIGELPWEGVESSNVEALAFAATDRIFSKSNRDPGSRIGYMWMRFKNGKVYCYPDVPEVLYKIVRDADSVGSAFNRLIAKNYPYQGVVDITTGEEVGT